MGCKNEDTKTRYQNIKIENIKTILKHWTKPNSVLAKKTKLSIPTICNYKRQIRENVVDGKLLLNFEHENTSNKKRVQKNAWMFLSGKENKVLMLAFLLNWDIYIFNYCSFISRCFVLERHKLFLIKYLINL